MCIFVPLKYSAYHPQTSVMEVNYRLLRIVIGCSRRTHTGGGGGGVGTKLF